MIAFGNYPGEIALKARSSNACKFLKRSVDFQPSEESKQRVADLIYREKTIGLTQDETSELDHYMQLEHLMRLAKARDRKQTIATVQIEVE